MIVSDNKVDYVVGIDVLSETWKETLEGVRGTVLITFMFVLGFPFLTYALLLKKNNVNDEVNAGSIMHLPLFTLIYCIVCVVWLLAGIWHGANWTFIVWGLFFFVLLVIEKQFGIDKNKTWSGHIYTMFFVTIAWALFRSTSISNAVMYIQTMLGFGTASSDCSGFLTNLRNYGFDYLIALIFSFNLPLNISLKHDKPVLNIITVLLMTCLYMFCVAYIMRDSYTSFIYFQF